MKKILTVLLTTLFTSLICVGCGSISSINSSLENSSSLVSSSSAEPIYEENAFSNNVYALVNKNGEVKEFKDYYRDNVSFNELVDRQIGLIATEIIERLNDIYGSTNFKYSYDAEVDNFSSWNQGEARGKEYKVYQTGDTYYVFLRDENGELLPATGENGEYYNEEYQYFFKTVYFRTNSDNNLDKYLGNPSAQALAAYLLNNNIPADTFGKDNNTEYEVNEQKLSILSGSIYGENVYYLNGSVISLQEQYSSAWNWSEYFKDGSAIDRLKYAIAKIIINNGYEDDISKVDYISYGFDYDQLVDNILFLSNYLSDYYQAINRYILNVIIGSQQIFNDNNSILSLASIIERAEEYNRTFEYIMSDDRYNGIIQNVSDSESENRHDDNRNYRLNDLFTETSLFNNYSYINNNNGTRTFEEEYEYLVENNTLSLKAFADYYMKTGAVGFTVYYNLYYGIDGLGYIDEAQTIKSLNQIEFPYTFDDMINSRNIKNYETTVKSILNAVSSQTFDENTHAGMYDSSLIDKSVYASYERIGLDKDITSLKDLGTISNDDITFNKIDNYNSFIIPASQSVNDLDLYIGESEDDISLEITVQTVDDVMKDNKVRLDNDYSSNRLNMVNDKFLIRKNENWHATFNLPKLTAIYLDNEEYYYEENNIYQTNGLDEVKDSLIITLKAYDSLGETIDLDSKYGVYFFLNK